MAEFAVNNKIHSAINISLFMANNGKELRMRADIRKKGKVKKAMEFTERVKKVQKEMKQQTDRERKEVEE